MEYEDDKEKNILGEPDLVVDFIRHGQASYTDEELNSGEIQGHLTQIGIQQIKDVTRDELLPYIDPNNEVVVIWVSPKRRAIESASLIKEGLAEKDIVPIKMSLRKSLSDVNLFGYHEEVDRKFKESDKHWMEVWKDLEDLPADVENPQDVSSRTNRLLTYLDRIARTVTPEDGKRLHFILVGHEETTQDLLETSFGIGAKEGEGQGNAEVMRMGLYKGVEKQNLKLTISIRGLNKTVEFDSEKRKVLAT